MRFASLSRTMSEKIAFELKNNLSEIERLSQIVTEFGGLNNLSPKVLFAVNLALEEILTNIISYGYEDNNEHVIVIRLSLKDEELVAEVEDDGRPFNPLEVPEPDISRPLEDRKIGGLGIHLVRNLMDGLEYRRYGGKNISVMKKRAM